MEKFINFPVLKLVGTGSGDTPGGVNLVDATATFTQFVRPNAIVWDVTTNAVNGGQMYIVTAVTSDTALALEAIGPTAAQGTGVPAAAVYRIFMPEYTKAKNGYGTADGTAANKLILSTATFILDGVEVGDVVFDITGGSSTTVTALDSNTQLSVADDIFVGGDNFLIMKKKANTYNKLVRATGLQFMENARPSTNTNNNTIGMNWDEGLTDTMNLFYAYSDDGAVGASSAAFAMVEAIKDAVETANQNEWSEVVYDFPGEANASSTSPNTTNLTWLGSKQYFIVDIAR